MRNITVKIENGLMTVKAYNVANALYTVNTMLIMSGKAPTAQPLTRRKIPAYYGDYWKKATL